jgi:hypothetical protein
MCSDGGLSVRGPCSGCEPQRLKGRGSSDQDCGEELKAKKGFKVQERSIGVTKAKHDVGALTARGDYVSRGANDAGQSGKLGQDASHGSDLKT